MYLFYLTEEAGHFISPGSPLTVPAFPLYDFFDGKVLLVMGIIKMKETKPPLPDVCNFLV